MNLRFALRPFLAALGAAVLLSEVATTQQQFAEASMSYMPRDRGNSRGVAAGDVDGDGDLDLVIAIDGVVYPEQSRLWRNDGASHFSDVTATHLPARRDPSMDVVLADLDGDGDLDLLTANWEQPNRLYLNAGNGMFADATAQRLPADLDQSWSLTVADVDGDGDLDLLFANRGQNRLYLNDGTAGFVDVTASRLPVSTHNTRHIAAGDIDGDGDLDLFLSGFSGVSLLYRNDGGNFVDVSGTQLPNLMLDTGRAVFFDMEGDGDLDLALAEWNQPYRLYANDGQGHFTDASSRLPGGEHHWDWYVLAADVDGDGDQDLLYPNVGKGLLYLNDGTGHFVDATATHLPGVDDMSLAAVLGDFDGDGDLDLVTANFGQDRLRLNDGRGRFVDATPQAVPTDADETRVALLGDVDGDGDLDMFLGNTGLVGEWSFQNRLYRNDGRGQFVDVTSTWLPANEDATRAAAFGDVDGDGDLDLLVGNANEQDRLLRNDGGLFTDVTASCMPPDQAQTTAVLLCDVDGDGDLDAVLASFGGQTRLYRNDGLGVFSDVTATQLPLATLATRALAGGDVDGDGDVDLVLGTGILAAAPDLLYRNDGSGAFTDVTAANLQVPAATTSCLSFGDVDGDGDLDLVRGAGNNSYGAENTLCLNDGHGVFTPRLAMPYLFDQTNALALGDVDHDGDLDLVVGDYGSPCKLYVNDGSGGFTDSTWQRMPADDQDLMGLALGDLDGDGDLDVVGGASGWHGWQTTVLWNRHRQLRLPELPRLGGSYTLECWAGPGYATAPVVALPFLSLTLDPVGLPTPYGRLWLSPSGLMALPLQVVVPPAGAATVTLALPLLPALLGLPLHSQALFVDAAAARLSNVTSGVLMR